MYIYVDVLIIINIYANFFLLKTTARLTHSPVKNGRCIAAAVLGSLFSLIILLPRMGALLLLAIRLLSAALMIVVTFGKKPYEPLFEKGLVFLFVCFIFAGVEYGLSVLSDGQNMIWHNSVLYVNISLLTLVISTIISYAAISFFRYYLDGKNSSDEKYIVTITKNGRTISLDAVGDTCNNLTDVFTGKPVIVCGKSSLSGLFEISELDAVLSVDNTDYISGWRLIPFSTIASEGMLRTFQPESVIVRSQESGRGRSADVYIGVVNREMEYAVFNPKIL